MHPILKKIQGSGRMAPCLFYPAAREQGVSVETLLTDAAVQKDVLCGIAQRYPVGAVIRMTELWCEAKAFGMACSFSDAAFPKLGPALTDEAEELADLSAPPVENETTAPLIEAVRQAAPELELPLIVGVTGPYTLGSVLGGSEDFMVGCMTEPEEIHRFLSTVTDWLLRYIQEYKKAGASGVMIAEPSVSMISPAMVEEFSGAYLEKIVSAVQDESFAVIYHNCGNADPVLKPILSLPAAAFHFGSAVSLDKAFSLAGGETVIMGNIEPQLFLHREPKRVHEKTRQALDAFGARKNYICSTGCDLSPAADPASVRAMLDAAQN